MSARFYRGHLEQLGKQILGMHGHACVHSVLMKTFFFFFSPSWYTHAKRNDFVVSGNVKSLHEMIPTNIFIYKQDIQHSECEKTVGPAGRGLISQAEKSFSPLPED